MARRARPLLLMLVLTLYTGCETSTGGGSGQIVMTPDGVVIDKLVMDGETMEVEESRIVGNPGRSEKERSERYIVIHHKVTDGQPIRIRMRNHNGGIAVQVDESLDEIVVESVVSIEGPSSGTKSARLAGVELLVTADPDGWLSVVPRWPGMEEGGAEQCVISVSAPPIDSLDL
ncbi:MAG: hypothetical protein VX641_02860 [Planctomycetota bacterium]|nr:hypothetical protein [Planctomycetota bacterium]